MRICLLAIVWLGCCTAQDPHPTPTPTPLPAGDLVLRPVLGRTVYTVGEPIPLLVGLHNRGDARRLPPPDVDFLRIEVLRPGARGFERFATGSQRVRRVDLPRDGIEVAMFALHLNDGRWWLREPGPHRVRIAYTDSPQRVPERWLATAECALELRATATGAAPPLMDAAVVRFVQSPNQENRAAAERALAAARADDALAAHVACLLGGYLARPRFDVARNRFETDHDAAIAQFQLALDDPRADPVTVATALRGLQESLRATGHGDDAVRLATRYTAALRDHKDHDVLLRWSRRREGD